MITLKCHIAHVAQPPVHYMGILASRGKMMVITETVTSMKICRDAKNLSQLKEKVLLNVIFFYISKDLTRAQVSGG